MDDLKKRFDLIDKEDVNGNNLKINKRNFLNREYKNPSRLFPIFYSVVILLICCLVSVCILNSKSNESNSTPKPNIEDNIVKLTTRKSLNYGIYYGSKKMLDKDLELDYLDLVGSDNVQIENNNDGIVSQNNFNYEFDFIEVFEVYSFNITCKDNFLFSQFNESEYEVIISKINIGNWIDEYLIIIKGENFIVSYLSNGYERSLDKIMFNFSSHKYLEGNSVEKNFSEDFYINFYVTINLTSKNVTEMYSTISNDGKDGKYDITYDYITSDKVVDYKMCDVSHIFQFQELTEYLIVNVSLNYLGFDKNKLIVSDNSILNIQYIYFKENTPFYLYNIDSNTTTPVNKENFEITLSNLNLNSNIQLRFMFNNLLNNEVTKVEQIILNYSIN